MVSGLTGATGVAAKGATAPDAATSGEEFASLLAQLMSPVATVQENAVAPSSATAEIPAATTDAAMAAQLAAMQIGQQPIPTPPVPTTATAVQSAATATVAKTTPELPLELRGTLSAAPEAANAKPTAPAPDAKSDKPAAVAGGVDATTLAALIPAQNKQNAASAAAPAKPPAAGKRSTQPAAAEGTQTPTPPPSLHGSKTAEATPSNVVAPVDAQSQTANATQNPAHKPDAAQPMAQAPAPALPAALAAQHFSAAVTTAPQTAVPLDALAVHIARKFESGANQFEISLHPAELGKLDISLSVADDGQLQASIRAERPETLDLLQRDSRNLEQQLRQAGLDVGSNALSFSLSNGNGNGRPASFTGWPAFAGGTDDAATSNDNAASKYVAVRIRDGVDIQV